MTVPMQTGFSRRIQLRWLERTSQLALAGMSAEEVRSQLHVDLADSLAVGSDVPGNARNKTVAILMRIWILPPQHLKLLHADALRLFGELPLDRHLVLHWGMVIAAYPFCGLVADVVGRLLRIQGHAVYAQAQRRINEQLGDRNTIRRSTRYALRSFVDWGVLRDSVDKGVYEAPPSNMIREPVLKAWLIEAVLHARSADSVALRAVAEAPVLFPFSFEPSAAEIDLNTRLEWFRQGLGEDMVTMRR